MVDVFSVDEGDSKVWPTRRARLSSTSFTCDLGQEKGMTTRGPPSPSCHELAMKLLPLYRPVVALR